MASLRKELMLEARPDDVWAAVRDVGALHTRLVPGFVVDTRMEGDTRVVTFGNGSVLREPIVDIDDAARRLVWGAIGGGLTHYNAAMQVFSEGEHRTRVVWVVDLLPNELAGAIGGLQDQALAAIKKTLEHQP